MYIQIMYVIINCLFVHYHYKISKAFNKVLSTIMIHDILIQVK